MQKVKRLLQALQHRAMLPVCVLPASPPGQGTSQENVCALAGRPLTNALCAKMPPHSREACLCQSPAQRQGARTTGRQSIPCRPLIRCHRALRLLPSQTEPAKRTCDTPSADTEHSLTCPWSLGTGACATPHDIALRTARKAPWRTSTEPAAELRACQLPCAARTKAQLAPQPGPGLRTGSGWMYSATAPKDARLDETSSQAGTRAQHPTGSHALQHKHMRLMLQTLQTLPALGTHPVSLVVQAFPARPVVPMLLCSRLRRQP